MLICLFFFFYPCHVISNTTGGRLLHSFPIRFNERVVFNFSIRVTVGFLFPRSQGLAAASRMAMAFSSASSEAPQTARLAQGAGGGTLKESLSRDATAEDRRVIFVNIK